MKTKKCTKCNLNKSIEDFHKNKANKDGLHAWCNNCSAINKHGKPYKGKQGTYKHKSIEFKDGTKICTSCSFRKDIKNFRPYSPKTPTKLRSTCEDCENIEHVTRKYNITKEDYINLIRKQDNKCAICNKSEVDYRYLSVDHDHVTNKVRGLLCHKHNIAIGLLQDNIEYLYKAIEYLKVNIENTLVKHVKELLPLD